MSASTADPPFSSRDALIEAAVNLMSRRSPSTISGRDLATEAGVNYGLVHYYFESARDLMSEARRLHGPWIVENLMGGGTRPVDSESALEDRRIFGFIAHVALEDEYLDPSEHRPAMDALLELVREADPDGDPVHHRATVAAVTLLSWVGRSSWSTTPVASGWIPTSMVRRSGPGSWGCSGASTPR